MRFSWQYGAVVVASVLLLRVSTVPGQTTSSGLAQRPPMGWNSWNKFQCDVSEKLIRSIADAIVSTGMKDAGYEYVVVDDCWQTGRDREGNLLADPSRFPSGMKSLSDYIHGNGLKFGMYSDVGYQTCGGRTASRGHEFQDAETFAEWGVDYLKYDWCHSENLDAKGAYTTMSDALKQTGRPIVFSMCEWGSNKPWLWATGIANLWRTTGDIHDCWDCKTEFETGFVLLLDRNVNLASFAGPGHWNDPDMLEVGNGGMTTAEYRSHFSLWSILAAPLIAGNDVRSMTPEIRQILTNSEVIAVDQDPLGEQGERSWKQGDLEVWSRRLADGSRAVVLFNRGLKAARVTVGWEEIGYPSGLTADVRDLWEHREVGPQKGTYGATVESHSVVMVKITPKN
jgi:alpha-galactosidase